VVVYFRNTTWYLAKGIEKTVRTMGYDNQSFGINFNLEKQVVSMLFHKP